MTQPLRGLFVELSASELSDVYGAVRAAGHPPTPAGVRAWVKACAARQKRQGLGVMARQAADYVQQNPEILKTAMDVGRRFLAR